MALPPFLHPCRTKLVCVALAAAALTASCVAAQQDVNLPAGDRALDLHLEEVFRVGKIDGADWEIFGERPEVAFDGAGNLYVFDPTSHRVVVIDPSGRYLRRIGQRGDGPGELRNPVGFVVMRDGSVAVADMGQAAFVVFGPDGEFQRSVSFRGPDGFTALGALHADPRGGSLLSVGQRIAMIQAGAGGGGLGGPRPSTRLITRFGLGDAGAPEIVFTGWEPPPPEDASAGGLGGIAIRPMPRAFEPGMFTAVLPNGRLVVSDSTGYDLKMLSPDGEIERVLRRPIEPTPVTPQIERAERERRIAESAAGGGPQVQVATGGAGGPGGGGGGGAPSQAQIQSALRGQLDQLQFYPELSVVTGLRAGWTGKVWVARRGSSADVTAPGPVDVLTPEGEYLGTIPANGVGIPDALGPDGLAAWIERDQFDTPIMVVRRLPAELR